MRRDGEHLYARQNHCGQERDEGPVSFALGTAARVVDGAGKIVTAPLRAGQKVRVYYTGTGDTRVVEHVQVEE